MKNGKPVKYLPDFYCPEENIYYEVVGTRQAYHHNKHKYILMQKEYPTIDFKIVNPDGSTFKTNKIKKDIQLKQKASEKKIKNLLLDKNVSQIQMASDLGIDQSTLNKIIRGWREATEEQKEKISKYLNVKIADIFQGKK
jgi:DNA-binding XRE family transcriptional regulator